MGTKTRRTTFRERPVHTETIDRLFLELAQFTTARTGNESNLSAQVVSNYRDACYLLRLLAPGLTQAETTAGVLDQINNYAAGIRGELDAAAPAHAPGPPTDPPTYPLATTIAAQAKEAGQIFLTYTDDYVRWLQEQLEAARERNQYTWCAYCGHAETVDGDTSRITAHVRTCAAHPMREVAQQLAKARAALARIQAAVADLLAAPPAQPACATAKAGE